MAKKGLFRSFIEAFGVNPDQGGNHQESLAQMGRVVPDANRCVQCGVCSYNCPVGIFVRDYACRGLPIEDPRCITCGQCIDVCPRGTLRWETQTHSLIMGRFLQEDTPEELAGAFLAMSEV